MSELIDRQDVIDRLKKAEDVFRQNGAKLEANGIHYALELVESDIEIPTVDITKTKMQYQIEINGVPIEKLGFSSVTVEARPQGEWICNPTYCYKCNQTNCKQESTTGIGTLHIGEHTITYPLRGEENE